MCKTAKSKPKAMVIRKKRIAKAFFPLWVAFSATIAVALEV
jgi:hypothetical protein